MLILPVGVENSVVRRIPWVSAVLIGLCILIHFGTAASDRSEEAMARFGEAVRYLAEHPYLVAPPAIEELLSEEFRSELARVGDEWSAHQDRDLVGERVASEQEELNRLSEAAFEVLHSSVSHRLGFVPASPDPVTLITHMFVHGGWLHLLGNMLFLFLSGPFIEDLYGRPLFAALYGVSGVVGAGSHALVAAESTLPLVGASGAIAGVMGAFLWRLSKRRIELLVLPIPIIPTFRFRMRLPAYVVLPLWAAEQTAYAAFAPEGSGVAFMAHVGGFAAGLAIAAGIHVSKVEERIISPAIEREISIEQHPGIMRASEARTAGDLARAQAEIHRVLSAEPQNVDAWTESWEVALASQDGDAVGRAGLKLIEIHRRAGERELALQVASDRRWQELHVPARFLLSAAELVLRDGDGRTAIDLYRRVAGESSPSDPALLGALIREGEILARGGDERSARAAFDRARAHPAFSELWQERIDRALRLVAKSGLSTRGA